MPLPLSTIADDLLEEVLARLIALPVIAPVDSIRRDHRTTITRDAAPAVHLVDGTETPTPMTNDCYVKTELAFMISIFVRDDAGYGAAKPIKIAVMAAVDPETAYPHSADLLRGRIISQQEIADADALRVDMEFSFKYQSPLWAL